MMRVIVRMVRIVTSSVWVLAEAVYRDLTFLVNRQHEEEHRWLFTQPGSKMAFFFANNDFKTI